MSARTAFIQSGATGVRRDQTLHHFVSGPCMPHSPVISLIWIMIFAIIGIRVCMCMCGEGEAWGRLGGWIAGFKVEIRALQF